MAIEALINIAQWVARFSSTSGHRTGTYGVLGLARNAWFYWVSVNGVAIPPSARPARNASDCRRLSDVCSWPPGPMIPVVHRAPQTISRQPREADLLKVRIWTPPPIALASRQFGVRPIRERMIFQNGGESLKDDGSRTAPVCSASDCWPWRVRV